MITKMNTWIKPNELPEGFWAECFVAINDGAGQIFIEIKDVKRMYEIPRWYSLTEQEWFDFRDDIQVRVMVVEYPEIPMDELQ